MRVFKKYNTKRKKNISSQAYEITERYSFGQPLAEYHPVFLRREVVRIIRCMFYLVLFVILAVLLIKSTLDFSNRRDAKELWLALCVVALFVFWIVDMVGIFRRFHDLSQRRTFLLVCQEGFLYFHNDHTEVVPWRQVQRYALTQPGISRQIMIYCIDGRRFQVDDRLDDFGNFLWRLSCQLSTGDRAREDARLLLPRVFRLNPSSRKNFFYLLLGGVAMVEGILWIISLNDPPLLAQTFGLLQFLIGWIVFVAIVMILLRQRLVSKLQIVLSQEGILYENCDYSIYTPWQNIVDVEDISLSSLFSLRLRVPARQGVTVKEGQEQGIAVCERHQWRLTIKHSQKNFPFTDVFPLDLLLIGPYWLQGEFAHYLRIYAPQICDENGYTK